MTPHILTRQNRIFIAIIVLIPFLCLNMVSAEDKLTIQINSDNTGTIDNSQKEKAQANCPETFGKFIPYNPRNPEYVEFRVTVPASSNTSTKRFLQLDLGSNDVCLWGNSLNGKKKLLSAPSMSNCTPKESEPSKQNINTAKGNNNILSLLDVNLDATEQRPIQDQDIKFSTENRKRTPYLIAIDNKAHTYTFYLVAVVGSQNSTWTLAKTNRRPTRTLTATIMTQKDKNDRMQKTSQQTSCQYIIVDDKSIYKSISEKEILSEVVAAWAVYYPDSHKWIGRYGLSEIERPALKQWGFTESELTEFFEQDEGFRVRFYHDWVHDKYYIAFKGTDIRTSFFGDMTNNALLCAGKFSPYLRKALQIGAVIHQRFPQEIRNNTVIVGHSLGGALASGAGIVSLCETVVFNGLGLTYSTLNETSRLFLNDDTKTNQYIRSRIEECFPVIPNSSFRKYDTSKATLRYFNTKYDLLNVAASEIYGLETRDDILPSALGVPYFPNNNSKPNRKDKVDQVRNLAKQIDCAVQAHQDDPEQFKIVFYQLLKNSFPQDWTSTTEWLKLLDNVNSKVDLYNQFTYALEQHSLDAIVHEILTQYDSLTTYGYTTDNQDTISTTSDRHYIFGKSKKEKDKLIQDITPEEIDKVIQGVLMFGEILNGFAQGIQDYIQRQEEEEREQREYANLQSKSILCTANIMTVIILLGILLGEYTAHKNWYNQDYEQLQPRRFILRLLTFTGRCSQTKYNNLNDILSRFTIILPIVFLIPCFESTCGLCCHIIGALWIITMCSLYSLRLHDINKSAFRLLPLLISSNLLCNGILVLYLCNPELTFIPIFLPWVMLFFVIYFIDFSNYVSNLILPKLSNISGVPYMNIYGVPEPESVNDEITYPVNHVDTN